MATYVPRSQVEAIRMVAPVRIYMGKNRRNQDEWLHLDVGDWLVIEHGKHTKMLHADFVARYMAYDDHDSVIHDSPTQAMPLVPRGQWL